VIDPDNPDPKILGLQIGVVVARDDPRGLGRVRMRIPGLVEPASPWALPMGLPGGGSVDRGIWWVPELGAEVAVLFKGGDPDVPFYIPANWGAPGGQSEVPDASAGGHPDVRVMAFGAYDLVVDSRPGSKGFKVVDRADGENLLEFDGVTRTLGISATTAVKIESTGQISIDGLVVTIKGIQAGLGQL
jgi:hypothetical protein